MVGVGVGNAASAALDPLIEPGKQNAWLAHPNRVLDPGLLAALIAKGGITLDAAVPTSRRSGYDRDKLNALAWLAQTMPGLADLDKLSNRLILNPGEVRAALQRHGYTATHIDALIELFSDLLSVSDIAAAVQQGHLPNPGILPEPSSAVTPATAVKADSPDGQPPTVVPLTQIDLPPIVEAAGQGIDLDRLKVIANLAGLPPGPEELLRMWNRELIDEASVDAGLREGHLKTKWAGAYKRLRWNVLSHIQYVDARVRGYIDNAAMYRGGAAWGFTPESMDLLHKTHGRPPSWHQVWVGIQRGGKILSPTADLTPENTGIDPTFFKALQQSDIQQQWYDIVWHLRWNYPSPFVLRQLSSGPNALTAAELTDVLTKLGWEPTFIDRTVTKWTGGTAGAVDSFVGKAETQLWTALHKAYVKTGVDRPTVESAMTVLVDSAADREVIFERWDTERTIDAVPGPPA